MTSRWSAGHPAMVPGARNSQRLLPFLPHQHGLGLTHGLILMDANAEPIQESSLTIEMRSLAKGLLENR